MNWIDPKGLQSNKVASDFDFTNGYLPQSTTEVNQMNRLPEQYNSLKHYGEAWGMFVGGRGGGSVALKVCKSALSNPETGLEVVSELLQVLSGDPTDTKSLTEALGGHHQQQVESYKPGGRR